MPTAQTLPLELLSEIFLLLRGGINIEEDRYIFTDKHGFAADWMRVTWVCRRWREAALLGRRLWTIFATPYLTRNPDAIRTFLSRAPDGKPLYIGVTDFKRRNWEGYEEDEGAEADERVVAFEFLRPWANRIKHLSVWMNCTASQRAKISEFLEQLGTSAPHLKTLALGSQKGQAQPSDTPALNFLGLSNLQTLYLGWLPSGNTPLPQIPRIAIKGVFMARRGDLQRFLVACTGVEELHIEVAVPERVGLDDPAAYPVIQLPQLKLLRMTGERPDAAEVVLGSFRLPSTTSFELGTVHDKPHRTRDLLRRTSWLRGTLPNRLENLAVLSRTRSLMVRIDDIPTHGRQSGDSNEGPPLTFELAGVTSATEVKNESHWSVGGCYAGGALAIARYRPFSQFLLDLPLIAKPTRLVQLELHFADWLPLRRQSLWRELFSQYHALRELVVGGWECIEAVTRTLEADPSLLPALQQISLCVNDFKQHQDAGSAMLRWLKLRQEQGNGLDKLIATLGEDVASETETFVEALVSGAHKAGLSLATEITSVDGCWSCGWERAAMQRLQDDGEAEEGERAWEWDVSEDEEEEEEEESESEEDDGAFWDSGSSDEEEDED